MSQKQEPGERTPLRQIVEAEGSGQLGQFGPDFGQTGRGRLVMLVQQGYRPSRVMVRSDIIVFRHHGEAGLLIFIEEMGKFKCDHFAADPDAALLADHNAASAYGLIGQAISQRVLNRAISDWYLEQCHDDISQLSPDGYFVYHKAFFGLVENDEAFRDEVGVEKWAQTVMRMAEERFPDYPGRALRLARYYRSAGEPQAAFDLLHHATSDEIKQYGKVDQIDDCNAELQQLLAQEPEPTA